MRHSRFLLARRRARLISPRRFPIRTVECGAAGRVASLKHGHLHYCARRAVQTSHGWQFLDYVNFGRYFATDATSCKAADLSARSIQPNPPSWSPSQWEITLPLSGELGQCLPGSPSSRSIRNRSVTLLRQPAQFGRSCGDRGWRRRRAPHQYPVATSARPHFPVSRCRHIGSERDRPSSRPTIS